MSDDRQLVTCEVKDQVAVVTIDRPPVNAWNLQLQDEFRAVIKELSSETEVRSIIIRGQGKAFIAGADLEMIAQLDVSEAAQLSASTQAALSLIADCPQVVIAAVDGLALGGGAEVALACDVRVAGQKAVFGFPEVGLGILPGAGGTQRLARLVGPGKAKEMILSGDPIRAEEALKIGLVERLAPQGQALEEATKLARRIALRGPKAVAKAKQAIDSGLDLPLDQGFKLESRLFSELFDTEDYKEGLAAFFEKRRPRFSGR